MIAFFTLITNAPVSAQTPAFAVAPLWQSGQSNWNGGGYETLPAPQPAPAQSAPTQPAKPHATLELPADQNGQNWSGAFGLSDSPLAPPVIGDAAGPSGLNSPTGGYDPNRLPLTDPDEIAATANLPIGSAIDEGETLDQPPLQEEVVSWYQVPWRWVTRGWDNHAEFGLDGSSGNADTLAIQTGLEMRRKTDLYTLSLDIDYRQASAQNATTEDNGRLNLDYDRLLGNSAWTAFGKFGLEYDEFKVFDLRVNANAGVGYYWIRDDRTNLITRFGTGASREIGAPDDDWTPEAVFGFEADHQLSPRQKIKAKLDYFPAWEDFSDFRLVADVAWETLLDNTENLSLRLSLTDRYDSTPQGAEANDVYYSALLLYKF